MRERDELARQNVELQTEMRETAARTSQQVERWQQHSQSASEHEAVVSRLRAQLEEMEASYRQAKSVRASLEAEARAARSELEAAQAEARRLEQAVSSLNEEHAEALGAREREGQQWKSKWKAQAQAASEAVGKLDEAERRLLSEAAAHAAILAARDSRLLELEGQLESGRPQEAQVLSLAREQAKRDEEVTRLRGQLKSLREMLKESHRVLKHLMRQEQLLKDELAETRRSNERSDSLNVDYLKNVLVAYLCKVYGDADDEEHIKLARVLQTILRFSPDEARSVDEKIAYYEASWWHRTANLLKAPDTTTTTAAAATSSAAGAGAGAAAAGASSWLSWFGGGSTAAPAAPAAPAGGGAA